MLDTSDSLDATTSKPHCDGHCPCGKKALCQGVTMSHLTRNVLAVALIAIVVIALRSQSAAQDNGAAATATDKASQNPDARPISDKDIQMLREDIRSQRKQLIAANMKLTDTQAEKF